MKISELLSAGESFAFHAKALHPIGWRWKPKEDITAYELAQLLPVIIYGHPVYEEDWAALGTATRHLERKPAP